MKRRRIPQSRRHKKLKTVQEPKEISYVKDVIIQKHRDQPLPRKLQEIMETKNQQKNEKINKKKKLPGTVIRVKPSEKFELCPGMTRIPKPLPEMVEKAPNESDNHFMNRLNRMVAQSLAEANLEDHFDVDLGEKIIPDKTTKLIPREDDDEKLAASKKEKREKRTEKNRIGSLRRKAAKLKRQHRLVRLLTTKLDDQPKRDSIAFGEVVHCPPTLPMLNKKIKQQK